MKKFKRIIAATAIFAVLAAVLITGASAGETESTYAPVTEPVVTDTESPAQGESTAADDAALEKNAAGGDMDGQIPAQGEADGTQGEADGTQGEADGTQGEADNIFAVIYAAVLEHADKIFSALAFIGTLLLSLTYKRGLLPAVGKAVNGATAAARASKDGSISCETAVKELAAELESDKLDTDRLIVRLDERLGELSGEVGGLLASEGERKSLRLVMSAQIDMLYDLFMASSIPEYQKEAVGNRVAAMRKELCSYEAQDGQ